jgi:hypothetical protein
LRRLPSHWLRWAFCYPGVNVRTRVRRHRLRVEHLADLGLGLVYGAIATVVVVGIGILAFCATPPGP